VNAFSKPIIWKRKKKFVIAEELTGPFADFGKLNLIMGGLVLGLFNLNP